MIGRIATWLRSLFLPTRPYRVWKYHKGWVPAGIVRATSWSHARRIAARRHRGFLIRIMEQE